MKYQNTSVTNTQYRTRKSMDEFEKNGLNNLLDLLYRKASKRGAIHSQDPLIYFNVSYETAAKVRANPTSSIEDISKGIADSFKRYDLRVHSRTASNDEIILCLWMMYAILYLQVFQTIQLCHYLSDINSALTDNLSSWCPPSSFCMYFSHTAPKMIEQVMERFHSPVLYPESGGQLPFETHDISDVPDVPAVILPPLPANCSEEGKRFYENCLQILELSVSCLIYTTDAADD